MKILWIPQLSAKDKETKKYLLHTDSNWRVFTDVAAGFSDDVSVDLAFPRKSVIDFDGAEMPECVNATYHNIVSSDNVFGSRFDFNFDFMLEILEKGNYDAVFLNDPCLANNLKVCIHQAKTKTKLLTYNHWIDYSKSPKLPDGLMYNIRQVEGALISDVLFTNSDFSCNMVADAASDWFNSDAVHKVLANTEKLQPPLNTRSLDKIKKREKKPIIAYNQRLASLQYYKDSYITFCDVMEDLYGQKSQIMKDVIVRFFNPQHYNEDFIKKYSFKYEFVYPKSSDEYLELLSECYLTADFYKEERIWSVALVEALYFKCKPILRYYDGYKELFEDTYSGYFESLEEAKYAILKSTDDFLNDRENYLESMDESIDFMRLHYSSEVIAAKVLSFIPGVK